MNGRRKKLALFLPSFRGGGAERVMVTLVRGFAERGVGVDVLVAQHEGPNAPAPSTGIRIVDLRASRVLKSLPRLVRYLRQESPDVLLSALPHVNVVSVLAGRLAGSRTRVVLTEHNTASLLASNSILFRARILPMFMRPAYPRADAVIAVSDGVADDLATLIGLDRKRIIRIYNPVVTPELLERAAEPLEHPWFGSGKSPVILGAGRLIKQKDFATLVRAFARVRERHESRLMIVGEGGDKEDLRALARSLGVEADVSFPGFVDNPYPYMKNSSMFALSSQWEGLPTVLLEAMACGTPVVSTDCPSGPREILEGGRHGALVPVGDPEALARAIAAQLGKPAVPTAILRAREFSLEAAVHGYREVLDL